MSSKRLHLKPTYLAALTIAALAAQTPRLSTVGCPMAHCDPHLNDAVRSITPSVGDVVVSDPQSPGAGKGLGCSSNGTTVACSFGSAAGSNLIAYDGDGNRIFAAAPGLLNRNAAESAPIVFTNGMVLMADNLHIILFNADGTTNWIAAKPDRSPTISPVLVGDIVFIATALNGTISTYDLLTGIPLSSFHVSDPGCGKYATANTPAVQGNRAYLVSACVADPSAGGLVAVDVVLGGPARGSMTQAWLYPFVGPSGASPLFTNGTLFFDGLAEPGSTSGTFLAVEDTGNSPRLRWTKPFRTHFAANAAQDPRGGIWVFPAASHHLYRLSNQDGSIVQASPVPIPAGETGPYVPSSAVSLSKATNGDIVLCYGAVSLQAGEGATVIAEDVSANALLWQAFILGPAGNQTAAQFPIVVNSQGSNRVVFPGSLAGTYFVGAPSL